MRTTLRVIGAMLLGAVASTAVVVESGRWWGLLLGYAAVLATVRALPPGFSTRLPFAATYAVVLGVAMQPRREGDYLIAADLTGYLVLALGLVVVMVAITTLPHPRGFVDRPDPG